MPKPTIDEARERYFDEYRSRSDLRGGWPDAASEFGTKHQYKCVSEPVVEFLKQRKLEKDEEIVLIWP